jgi:GT2 family glycosyltransferase
MNISIVTQHIGRYEEMNLNAFVRLLDSQGHRVSILLDADSPAEELEEKISRFRLPQTLLGADALRLADQITDFAADSSLLHLDSAPVFVIGAMAAARLNIPFTVRLDESSLFQATISAATLFLFEHIILRDASKVFCASEKIILRAKEIQPLAPCCLFSEESLTSEISDLASSDTRTRDELIETLRLNPDRPLLSIEMLRVLIERRERITLSAGSYLRMAEREESFLHQQQVMAALSSRLKQKEAEIEKMRATLGWKLLQSYGRIKYRYLLPVYKLLGLSQRPSNNDRQNQSPPPKSESARKVGAKDFYSSLTIRPELGPEEMFAVLEKNHPVHQLHLPDVVCFSIIPWEFRYQRPQQIMSQFAAHSHRVFYISPSRFKSNSSRERVSVKNIKENIYEIELAVEHQPDLYRESIEGENLASLLSSIEELRRRFSIDEAISYVMIASWGEAAFEARARWGWPIVYDCMDEWDTFPHISRAVVAAETRLVKNCDLTTVTAQQLFDKWKYFDRPLALARNAVDDSFYLQHFRPNSLLEDVPRPVVGYYGAIADWFDLELMAEVAKRRPQYTFVLIGGVFDVDVSALEALANVRLLGQQPYEKMPQYLHSFGACIIPFKVNAVTEATDPVKLYEYLIGGKPVVAVALPELEACRDLIYTARKVEDFLARLDEALSENDPQIEERRKEFARQNTWRKRYEQINEAIAEATPRASIIIVTYNNIALNRLCLESIIRNTAYPNYEIIVVDNNSADGTQDYLLRLAASRSNLKVILNQKNEGFARANNQGINESSGQYIVLLNNDTIVPPAWLTRLIFHLRDERVGLIGPVTNFAGNEARIETNYRTWAEMENFAAERMRSHDGLIADIKMLAMFCVAFRRQVYEEIGPLDEQFGLGMFEDDDYSLRVKARGYRVVCAADTFVHHFGQASFGKLIDSGQYDLIFEENRRRFEAKWNVKWMPHSHAQLRFSAHQTNRHE